MRNVKFGFYSVAISNAGMNFNHLLYMCVFEKMLMTHVHGFTTTAIIHVTEF